MTATQQDEKDRKRRKRRVRLPRSPRQNVMRVVGVTAGVLVIAAGVVAVFNPPWNRSEPSTNPSPVSTPAPDPTGAIAEPTAGLQATTWDVPATGTVLDVPEGSTAWVVTEIIGPAGHRYWEERKQSLTGRLWPAPAALTPQADGSWATTVALSPDRNVEHAGLQIRIALLVVDDDITGVFQRYAATAANAKHPGVATLSTVGITRLDEVDVVLTPTIIF
jgi:hypothetical protein